MIKDVLEHKYSGELLLMANRIELVVDSFGSFNNGGTNGHLII
jgi:hypothetical protein